MSARAELIVLASPPSLDDEYYQDVMDDIFEFHIEFANQILAHGDDVLILSNSGLYDDYVTELGEDKVLKQAMADIWMRDFTVVNPGAPLMFRYSAAGQGGAQEDSDFVQEVFAQFLEKTGNRFRETNLINDGGNYVDDYNGNVIISRKFLSDNGLTEEQARSRLTAMAGIDRVAFIEADEQGGLEHADGVVSFVDKGVLVINTYDEDPDYAAELHGDLEAAFPDLEIHEIVTPYDASAVYDKRFGSACGLYTNALVTPERIYFPQFGIAEDAIAMKQMQKATSREVVPVQSKQVCHMGGGVRCMSLQLRGGVAESLLGYVKQMKNR